MRNRLLYLPLLGMCGLPAVAAPPPEEPPGRPPREVRLLTLDSAVREALGRSPTLQAAAADVRRAAALVTEARALRNPRFDATVRGTVRGPNPSFDITLPPAQPGGPTRRQTIEFGRTFTRNFAVGGSYDPDPFGRLRLGRQGAGESLQAVVESYYAAQNELVFAVQQLYLGALRQKELVQVAREAVQASQEQLRVAEANRRAGLAADYDVLRARVQVENNLQSLRTAEAAQSRTLTALGRLLSLEPEQPLELAPVALPPDPVPVAVETADDVLAREESAVPAPLSAGRLPRSLRQGLDEAFSRRPEVARADWARRAAETQVRIQRRGNSPTLALSFSLNFDPDQTGFAVEEKTYSLVANLSIPIWDGGLTRARTRQAEAEADAARARARQAREEVVEDVRTALVDLRDALDRRRTAGANTVEAREALRIARVRFQAGIGSTVEVADAESALTRARTNEVNAAYDALEALAGLNRALGRYADRRLAVQRP